MTGALFPDLAAEDAAAQEGEFYPTPAWCVAASSCERRPLEQAARNLRDVEDRIAMLLPGDFLRDVIAAPLGDVYIRNPPFSLALKFAQQCLRLAGRRGHVALLLRQAFTETPTRGAFLREHPCDLYTLDKRPKFKGGSGSDKWAYAWLVWGPGRGGRWKPLECP